MKITDHIERFRQLLNPSTRHLFQYIIIFISYAMGSWGIIQMLLIAEGGRILVPLLFLVLALVFPISSIRDYGTSLQGGFETGAASMALAFIIAAASTPVRDPSEYGDNAYENSYLGLAVLIFVLGVLAYHWLSDEWGKPPRHNY